MFIVFFIIAVLGAFSLLTKFKASTAWFPILLCMYISACCCCAIMIVEKMGVWESVVLGFCYCMRLYVYISVDNRLVFLK